MAPSRRSPAGAACAALLLLLLPAAGLLLLSAAPAAAQAPEPEDPATIEQAAAAANGTRGASRGGAGSSVRKLASSIDCQICEATCRVKCLINNLFQWGGCYQRCKTDNCNDWCR